MTQTFTQDDLIRYLYQETTARETREIDKALISDPELQKQYRELVAQKKHLDEAQLEPSSTCVEGILDYARSLQEKH